MDKNTLSNYGWIVIAVLVLSVMIALATPFGQYIENGVKATTQGLFDTSEKAMNVVGMSAGDGSFDDDSGSETSTPIEMLDGNGQTIQTSAFAPLSFRSAGSIDTFKEVKVNGVTVDASNYTVTEGSTTVTFNADYTKALTGGDYTVEIIHDNGVASATMSVDDTYVLPTGASYYVKSTGKTLQAGETMPTTPSYGDRFYYGDFAYGFGCLYTGSWDNQPGCDYWFVAVADFNKQTVSGKIMENIGTYTVTSMQNCFMNWNGTDASGVVIHSSITNMNEAFMNSSVKFAPVIPSSVKEMSYTFISCMALKDITINATPTVYDACFAYTAIDDISDILGDCQNKAEIFETVNSTPWG